MARRGQLEVGPLVAAAGGALLFVSLFLDWYRPGISGWTVFETLDLLLAALGLAAVGVLAARLLSALLLAGDREIPGGSAAPVIGGLALLVVAAQALNHPPAAVDRGADVGQWLALSAAGLMLAGGMLGLARLPVTASVDRRQAPSGPSGERAARPPGSPRSQGAAAREPRPAGSDDPTEQLDQLA